MSEPSAPLQSRQSGMSAPRGPRDRAEQRAAMLTTVVFFILGPSVILSFDWTSGGFRPDAATIILFGVLVAAIIHIALRQAALRHSKAAAPARLCPTCGRAIPPDSLLCPYCGQRLS